MPMPYDQLKELLIQKFPNAQIKLTALKPDDNHYAVSIVSDKFCNLNHLNRHRLVMQSIHEDPQGKTVHALSIKTLTPEEQEPL